VWVAGGGSGHGFKMGPALGELLAGLDATIQDLQPHQVQSFYESVALMVGAESDAPRREDDLSRLMALPNATWTQALAAAASNADALRTNSSSN
jgi:exportin-1